MQKQTISKYILHLFCCFLLYSCEIKNPDWIKGEWIEKSPSKSFTKSPLAMWKFINKDIYTKIGEEKYFKCSSSGLLHTVSKINQNDRFILKYESATESEPYFQIFEKISAGIIKCYDSSLQINSKWSVSNRYLLQLKQR